jgi:predicted ArsR family transcriptional regulator
MSIEPTQEYINLDKEKVADKNVEKTREKILQLLKLNGETTVGDLSQELGVSSVNIRGHLSRLERDGLVMMRCEKTQDRGRPSHLYKLTDKGHATFPSTYNQLASDVLNQVKRLFGIQAVRTICTGRMEEFLKQLQERCKEIPLDGTKMDELAKLLRSMGYICEVNESGNSEYVLTIKHCPISEVATDFPEICAAELKMQREALNAKVTLKRMIPQGGVSCYYRIVFNQK